MDKIEEIKQYFQKLQRIVKGKGEFALFGRKLIKKEKIDDILCCLLAVLPDKYKHEIKFGKEKLNSIICYKAMFKSLKGNFPLSKSVYLVHAKKASDSISAILKCIEADIKHVENA